MVSLGLTYLVGPVIRPACETFFLKNINETNDMSSTPMFFFKKNKLDDMSIDFD
jgi:hypothetical protein